MSRAHCSSLLEGFFVLVAAVLVVSGVHAYDRSLFGTASEVVDISDLELLKVHTSAGRCPWILVAYSDGCGHCRSAAPSIMRCAQETFETVDDVVHDVTIAALNCQVNTQVCHDLGVHGVPSFFFLMPSFLDANEATMTPVTLHVPKPAADKEHNMEMAITNVEAATQSLHRFNIGSGGRIDAHLDHARRIWSATTGEQWSAHSKERCLDMRNFLRNAKLGDLVTTLAPGETALEASTPFKEDTEFHSTDVANAFFYTLYHEVALVGLEFAEQRWALYRFVRAVQQRLPGLAADVLLHEMSNFNTNTTPADTAAAHPANLATFTVEEWQKLVLSVGIPFQGTPRDLAWQTCRGSSWRYRGFPCGLWLLYHALSANEPGAAAENDGFNPLAAAGGNGGVADAAAAAQARTEILFVIKDYVRHFFSCETCRQHFMHFDPNHEDDPVWQLWKVHNVVNSHLANVTEGADPLVPKRRFPEQEMCPLCYRHIDGGTPTPESGVVVSELLKFLRRRYRWVPSTLRKSTYTTASSPAASAVVGVGTREKGVEVILVQKTPMSINIFLSMTLVVVVVLFAMYYVLRSAKMRKFNKQRPILPLRTQLWV